MIYNLHNSQNLTKYQIYNLDYTGQYLKVNKYCQTFLNNLFVVFSSFYIRYYKKKLC